MTRWTIAIAFIAGVITTSFAAESPRQGGHLTVAVEADLRESDSIQVEHTIDRLVMGSTVFDALFQTDENGNPAPALAREAVPSEDAKTWVFRIREGVKFHNGKVLTAEDIVENLAAFKDPANASVAAGRLSTVSSFEATGEYEVTLTLTEANGQLPAQFTDTLFISDMDDHDPQNPIGTGPYKWEGRVLGDSIKFSRFEDHWRGVPPFETVTFRVIPDAQVAALELRNGSIDILPNYVPPEQLPALQSDPNISLYSTPGSTVYLAGLNFEKERRGGYKDAQAVREGLAYLWNAQEIVPALIGEFGELATQIIPPWQLGHDPSIESWPYDPEKGKQLLAQGGIEEGDTIKILVWERPFNCDHATAFASLLTGHGYQVDLQCLPPEAAVGPLLQYDWDLIFYRTSGRPTAAVMYYDRWRKALVPNPPDDFYTLRNDELENVISDMLATPDQDKYVELAHRAAQIIMKEEIAALPAYFDKVVVATRSNVKGMKVSGTGWYGLLMNEMTTVWLDE